jgi:hypothetical protein
MDGDSKKDIYTWVTGVRRDDIMAILDFSPPLEIVLMDDLASSIPASWYLNWYGTAHLSHLGEILFSKIMNCNLN